MRTTLAIVAILALAGCATSAATKSRFSPYAGGQAELDLAKRAVLASLKDPESARFGSATFYQRHNDGAKFLCIYVNSKNSIGAYGGMHPATVSFKDGKVVDVDFLNARNAVPCKRRGRNSGTLLRLNSPSMDRGLRRSHLAGVGGHHHPHPAAVLIGGDGADDHAQLSLRSGEWR